MAVVIERALRTPESAFEGLKGFPYEPKYFTTHLFCAEGLSLRMAYIDEGPRNANETLLLTHGEPSWSFLYRRMIPVLLQQGYRIVAPDLVGFGRSDKPVNEGDYSYERHVAWLTDVCIHHLDLRNVTAVFQDWGGLLGLRMAAAHSERFSRLVIANTFLPTCDNDFFKVPDGFFHWKAAAPKLIKLPIGEFMANASYGPSAPDEGHLNSEDKAGYSAPFPDDTYKAGARRFPELVPTPPSDPTGRPQMTEGENNKAAWEVFKSWTKPVLTAFSDEDRVMLGCDKVWLDNCPGCKGMPHVTIKGCSHFLQDGGAEQLSQAIITFISQTPNKTSRL